MRKSTLHSLLPLFIASLLATSTATLAQGFYEFIPYYNNGPFTFCTHGVPEDCWAPVDPGTDSYTITNEYCFNPVSASLYAQVCPHAFQQLGTTSHNDVTKRTKEAI